jgi:hypothetical protein
MNTFKEGFIKYGVEHGHIKKAKTKEEDKPDGKVYSLTGAKGTACIATETRGKNRR